MTKKELLDEFLYVDWEIRGEDGNWSIYASEELIDNMPPVIDKISEYVIAKKLVDDHNRSLYTTIRKERKDGVIKIGEYSFNPIEEKVYYKDEEGVKMQIKESLVLLLLARDIGKKVTQKNILRHVWGSITPKSRNSLKVMMFRIRQFLKKDSNIEIRFLEGGYVLNVYNEK